MNGLAPFSAFAICWLAVSWLLRRGRLPMDHPNERSLHAMPTPRIGGLGIMAGVLVAAGWLAWAGLLQTILPVVVAAFALAAISLLDDVRGLPVVLRFLAHFVAAAGCLLALGLTGWTLVAGTLAVVWMTNLYNFMDGSDGLAGGMAAIGFGALALAAWLGDASELALFSAAIAAAALAFLHFNFPPARVFMGDAGSIPLGFLAASLGILGARQGIWSWLFPLLVFSPFIVDASVTLARRGLRGEKIWQAHRSHYYQRVVLLGASHRELALAAYALMLAMAVLAFTLRSFPQHSAWVLILSSTTYLLIFLAIDRRWRQSRNEP
ncbi:MAG: glycosyltransferase family 4 protein [Thiobacillus sp.]|jgi:UDP-N-acetylmuramyl pentapeptide phosphotransferase/UDP-N-acetylglucosamine-1-phosphate transferase|uniref:MraY family glycosyltransferase n=1 Tax=Thiobacillus sp. TaxID=924 RepID=UPI0028960332|nr:glycosyltransferase family 4 protein [Thiobacillus sp.]MDT3705253.1 glycosyltransferase family 4 protein [Thiobacillus sp.]